MATPKLEVSALPDVDAAPGVLGAPLTALGLAGVLPVDVAAAPDAEGSRPNATPELNRSAVAKANGRLAETATIFRRLILREPIAIRG